MSTVWTNKNNSSDPTRERSDVLEKSLITVTSQDYGNLEVIVSDNYSCDDTEDVVRSTNDARVKYINTGKRVSMSHNWSLRFLMLPMVGSQLSGMMTDFSLDH